MSKKNIALALQGGGSHGAFSWGVLDCLLDAVIDGELNITALSGASAGGFSAALVAYGLGSNGSDSMRGRKAKALLERFWMTDGSYAPINPYSALAKLNHEMVGSWNIDALPAVLAAQAAGALFSPYYLPVIEWLKLALSNSIDFKVLQTQKDGPDLYITATNINHTRRDIFARTAVTYDVLAAGACIPSLFQAHEVTVQGITDYYWDGGFVANPALAPIADTGSDIVVVQINPFERPDSPPRTPWAILDRLNEINFNASLILEMSHLLAHNKRLVLENKPQTHLHVIESEAFMQELGYASKMVIHPEFLQELRAEGYRTAKVWLDTNAKHIGSRDTLNPGFTSRLISVSTAKSKVIV